MPPRIVSLGILIGWALAASALLVRDVLPDLLVGPPPDFRDVAEADGSSGPTRWTLLADDPSTEDPDDLRAVGQAITETTHQLDGHVRFENQVWFDSGLLLEGTPLESAGNERLEIRSLMDVDQHGNLNSFYSGVRLAGDERELLVLEGRLESDAIEVRARGPILPWGERTFSFPYRARGIVQNAMGPLERLPGLHVGQQWSGQVISPLTGRVEQVRFEVTRRNVMIPWGDAMVPTYELTAHFGRMSARTWARASDGLVLRQEVPLMFVRLVLERQPERAETPIPEGRR